MIRNDSEYRKTEQRLSEAKERLEEQRRQLREMGHSQEEVDRGMAPMESFYMQLQAEIEEYENLKRGITQQKLRNLEGLGTLLVKLRIASGLTQRELAKRLGVDESQVSRDERNEYHRVTDERTNRILNALGFEMLSVVKKTEAST